MSRTIFFVHSAGKQSKNEGSSGLLENIEINLGDKFKVIAPIIENPENPSYTAWKPIFDKVLSKMKNPVILIGHSFGGSMILKYLAESPVNNKIKGLFLIATPFWGNKAWDYDAYKLKSGFPEKMPKIDKVMLYHSKNDPVVDVSHAIDYHNVLPKSELKLLDGDEHTFTNGLPQLIKDIKLGESYT